MVGRFKAQEFVHRQTQDVFFGFFVGCLLQVRQQTHALLGPFLQADERVADQVGGGLVPGVEQEDALVVELALGELLAVLLARCREARLANELTLRRFGRCALRVNPPVERNCENLFAAFGDDADRTLAKADVAV